MATRNITKEVVSREICLGNVKATGFKNHFSNLRIFDTVIGGQYLEDSVRCMDLDATGRLLTGTVRGSLSLFDIEHLDKPKWQYKLAFNVGREEGIAIETLKWFPGKPVMFVTGGGDKCVTIWDSKITQPVERFRFRSNITQVALSSVGGVAHGLIAVTSLTENVKLVDLKSGQNSHELQGLGGRSVSCTWSPSVEYLIAVGCKDCKVRLWDIRSSGRCLSELTVKDCSQSTNHKCRPVNGVIFTSDSTRLVTACGTEVSCWDVEYHNKIEALYEPIFNYPVRPVQLVTAACGSFELCVLPSNGDIVAFDIKTGKRITKLSGHFGKCNCLVYNMRTMELFSGGDDNNIIQWSAKMLKPDL